MSYLVLARKWRPRQFAEVVAQEHVTRTLENAIKQNRLASAYLFTGPRVVGKTTMARLLAKAVNCEKGPTTTPCDVCTNCREIADGRSLDVMEIDGASNRGIDEVRNLRENARYTPAKAKYKIYILDEVHMLTEPAFNALLKTLEEPPPHVLFIFATTEVPKVPATILSRCQRFDFRRVPLQEIVSQLKKICEKESIQIDEASLFLIAKKSEGSMRDSQSLLDQVIAYSGQQVRREEVAQLFGIIDQEIFFACSDAIAQRDARKGLELSEHIYTAGYQLGEFLDRLAEHFSNILTTRVTSSTAHLFGLDGYIERFKATAAQFSEIDLMRYVQMITDTQNAISRAANPRVLLEMLLLKMIQHAPGTSLAATATTPNATTLSPTATDTRTERSANIQSTLPSEELIKETKKKPRQPADHLEASSFVSAKANDRFAPVSSADAEVRNIPLVSPVTPRIKFANDRTEPAADGAAATIAPAADSEKADSAHSSVRSSAPPRTTGSLFDQARLPGFQKVPIVRANEPPIPQRTNITDAKEALDKIQQKWFHIVEQVKSERISLGSFLELGLPTRLSEGTLEICFDQGNGFQINSINHQKTFIQEIIERETGYRVRLVCRKDESKNLTELRAQLREATVRNGNSGDNERSTELTAEDHIPNGVEMSMEASTTAAKRRDASAQAGSNGDTTSYQIEATSPVSASGPKTLDELLQTYPAVKKLVEALDGELIQP